MSIQSTVDSRGRIEQLPIWLPGRGVVDIRESRVDRAVQEYDERLRFGRNENDGQYCIFIKMPPSDDVWPELYPVLGFGFTVPEPHEALQRLEAADTRRHGEEMLDRVNRHNERLSKQLAAQVDEQTEELAMASESFMRNQEQLNYSKSYSRKHESEKGR